MSETSFRREMLEKYGPMPEECDPEFSGPRGTLAVGAGSRDNQSGWVVYVPGAARVSDPVYRSRAAAVREARRRVGS